MTPKEKAKELVDRFYEVDLVCADAMGSCSIDAKQCALICVDELIKEEQQTDDYYELGSYWEEVKQEIEKL